MLINTQYTFEDYREANAFDAAEKKNAARRKPFTIIFGLTLGLLVGAPLIIAVQGPFTAESRWEWCIASACITWEAAMFLWCGFLVIVARNIRKNQLRKMWAGQWNLHQPRTIQITAESVLISQTTQHTEYRWPAFLKYRESSNLLLLYPSEFHFVIIPKRELDSAQLGELRILCQNYLKGGKGGFPVEPEG